VVAVGVDRDHADELAVLEAEQGRGTVDLRGRAGPPPPRRPEDADEEPREGTLAFDRTRSPRVEA
jgi:hypothetical protein